MPYSNKGMGKNGDSGMVLHPKFAWRTGRIVASGLLSVAQAAKALELSEEEVRREAAKAKAEGVEKTESPARWRRLGSDSEKAIFLIKTGLLGYSEVGRLVGKPASAVYNIVKTSGIDVRAYREMAGTEGDFGRGWSGKRMARHDVGDMLSRFMAGETMSSIAHDAGLSRERVRQLLTRATDSKPGKLKSMRDQEAMKRFFEGLEPGYGYIYRGDCAKAIGVAAMRLDVVADQVGIPADARPWLFEKPLDPEQERLYREIVEKIESGMSQVEVAREMGLSQPFVSKAWLDSGRPKRRLVGVERRVRDAEISAEIAEGGDWGEIARKFGLSPNSLKSMFRKDGTLRRVPRI